jgi:CheY-like chemotaxis protein
VSDRARRRILLIDRDPMVLNFLRWHLEELHAVAAVRDGGKALDLLRQREYDLILLDLGTPGPGGSDMARALAMRPAGTPVLVASADPAGVEVARCLGAADWIAKPYSLRELEEKVARLLAGPPAPCGTHELVFFGEEGREVERVVRFAADGLDRGQAVALIVTPPHRKAIARRLNSGPGLDRLAWLDAHEAISRVLVNGQPDERAFRNLVEPFLRELATRPGVKGIRLYGEAVGVLADGGQEAQAARLEELWNAFQRQNPMDVL